MTDPLSPSQIAELRRLHEAATEAPWAWEPTGDKDNSWGLGVVADDAGNLIAGYADQGVHEVIEPVCESIDGRHADAALIAEARNALPALLATVEAQAAVIERYRNGWGTVYKKWAHRNHNPEPMSPAEQVVVYGEVLASEEPSL
jgi:hypothetical protein